MSIRALIFDLDGTAIPNSPSGVPSPAVIRAVEQAKSVVKVACATGREISIAHPVITSLQLASPCIVAGGAQIIDPISFVPIWQKLLSAEMLREVVSACSGIDYMLAADSDPGPAKKAKSYNYFNEKPILYMMSVRESDAPSIVDRLRSVQGVSVMSVKAWTAGDVDIHITHEDASKRHALEEWMRIEDVNPEEVIAIGDSANDIPLLEIAGTKIAMGNGSQTLKKMADWIAPPVDEDGLVTTIEKYIL